MWPGTSAILTGRPMTGWPHGVVPGSIGLLERQRRSEFRELGEGGFEFLDDLGGEHRGGWERCGIVQ